MKNNFNDVLLLKGELSYAPNTSRGSNNKLRKGAIVKLDHLKSLKSNLESIKKEWNSELLDKNVLVTATYREIVAKTNRLTQLLKPNNCSDLSELICGSRFNQLSKNSKIKHIITYKTTIDAIDKSIASLKNLTDFLSKYKINEVTNDTLKATSTSKLKDYKLSRSSFSKIIKDSYFVESFYIDSINDSVSSDENSLISLYRIGSQQELINLLQRIGITISSSRFLNQETVLLYPNERKLLFEKAGWLVAMEVSDLMQYDLVNDITIPTTSITRLPEPSDEPTIGVIDTRFDKNVYFSKWVDYYDLINKSIRIEPKDYNHGTSVTSIIVNGPLMNPNLDDGCGYFRVRHFAVASHGPMSSFEILRNIKQIVRENPDIKVWNLSLGSKLPCPENFISPEGAMLDQIQREYDVIFVIAATNDPSFSTGKLSNLRIGSPADAINPITVGSCDKNGNPAPYSRKGPVLHFFIKPDISCFGGVTNDPVFLCTPNGREPRTGTSFAAPWVSRKLAFMIHKLQLSRSEAKALLIDSCVGWQSMDSLYPWKGWGCVPIHINEIIHSNSDEIRFVISGSVKNYETFNYNIPVPLTNDSTIDYSARATLCYFPECRHDQGVDYTLTELDLHFGRVDNRKNKTEIVSIDNNRQCDPSEIFIPEENARTHFRKWDNVKVRLKTIKRDIKSLNQHGLWGLKIYSKERLSKKYGKDMPFSLVVTLKSIRGINRHANFLKACQARGWLVNSIDVESRLTISSKMNQHIDLDN